MFCNYPLMFNLKMNEKYILASDLFWKDDKYEFEA